MENEKINQEPIGPYKKSKDIVITQNQLKKIIVAIVALILIFLAFTYFNSGLTHRKAKEVFIDYWNKENSKKLGEVKILGIKKLKVDSYWVKINYSILEWEIPSTGGGINWDDLLCSYEEKVKRAKERGLELKLVEVKYNVDYIYTEWDTGWFIEKKKN